MVRTYVNTLLVAAFTASACSSYTPEAEPGTRIQSSYPSLDQRPVRGGKANLLPAPISARAIIGPNITIDVVESSQPSESHVDDPSAKIAAGGVGVSAVGYGIGAAGAFSVGTGLILMAPFMLAVALEEADLAADKRTIIKSVADYRFPERLKTSLMARFDRARQRNAKTAAKSYRVGLRMGGYGLVQRFGEVSCFAFDGELKVQDKWQVLYQAPIVWRAGRRSADLPPVRCASLDDLASRDGALVREILNEATVILAAAAVRRLQGERP
jgi:hypothetical protein